MRKNIINDPEAPNRTRSVILFDSFTDLLDHNLKKDYRSEHMGSDRKFYGANDMKDADTKGRRGLPKVGVEAIELAKHNVALMNGKLTQRAFYEGHDVAGAFVDMGRYVAGEPESMVEFFPMEELNQNKIVALIMNITYNCMISASAIKKNGQAMMALVEAVEMSGMQAEIWVDMYVSSGFRDSKKYYARTAVKLKNAGEPFDVGMFMYALTHESFLRAHIFNAMHTHDESFRKAIGIHHHGGYGNCIHTATDMDDFPPYSMYIPVITDDHQAGEFVPKVLRDLNLLKAS